MDKAKNFLEYSSGPFPASITKVAYQRPMNAGPMIACLERIQPIMRGLEQVFKIAANNRIQESGFDDDLLDDDEMAPLSPNTIDALLQMGCAISAMVADEITDLASWARDHALPSEPKSEADHG